MTAPCSVPKCVPAASFAEATGTLVNMEGRAQRYFQNFDPAYYDRTIETLESWRWLGRISGGEDESENLDDVLEALEAELTQFKGVARAAPGSKFRMHGMGLARAPHRQSGRTAARAIVFVHEPRSTKDADTALNFSMEGYSGAGREDRPPELLPFAWAPGWNSPQAWNKFQTEVGGALRGGDPGRASVRSEEAVAPLLLADDHAEGWSAWCSSRCTNTSVRKSCRTWPIRFKPACAKSYVMFNALDAQRLGFDEQSVARITIGGVTSNSSSERAATFRAARSACRWACRASRRSNQRRRAASREEADRCSTGSHPNSAKSSGACSRRSSFSSVRSSQALR